MGTHHGTLKHEIKAQQSGDATQTMDVTCVFTCVFPSMHLQVREFEVSLAAAGVRAHERAFLTWFSRPHDGGADAWYSPHVLGEGETGLRVSHSRGKFTLVQRGR